MATKYPTDPTAWPDPLKPKRPEPPIADRLRVMRDRAALQGYGPIDRQGLMLNPEEIEQLLALLERG